MNCHNFDQNNIDIISKKHTSDMVSIEDYFIELFESSSEHTQSLLLDKTSHSYILYDHTMVKYTEQFVSAHFGYMLRYHVNGETKLSGYIFEYRTKFGEQEALDTLLRCLSRIDGYVIYYKQRKSFLKIYLLFKGTNVSDPQITSQNLILFNNI